MCSDANDQPKRIPKVKLKEPNESRIKSQDEIKWRKDPNYSDVNHRLTRSYSLFIKPKQETPENSSSDIEKDAQSNDEKSENEQPEFEEST